MGLLSYATKRLAAGNSSGLLDPFGSYNFMLDIHGVIVGGFTRIEGMGARVSVKRFHEGGENTFEHVVPENISFGDLVLSSGLTFMDPMWLWYKQTLSGTPIRKNGTIYLLDQMSVPSAMWHIHKAWPVDWVGPSFDSSQSTVAVQQFTLVCERVTKSVIGSTLGAGLHFLEGAL